MNTWLGTSLGVFLGCTVVMMGLAAYATGRAVATTWGSLWHVIVYSSLLSLAARFFIYALFNGELRSLSGWSSDWLVLNLIALISYRLHHVRKMTSQYPWLYTQRRVFGLHLRD